MALEHSIVSFPTIDSQVPYYLVILTTNLIKGATNEINPFDSRCTDIYCLRFTRTFIQFYHSYRLVYVTSALTVVNVIQ